MSNYIYSLYKKLYMTFENMQTARINCHINKTSRYDKQEIKVQLNKQDPGNFSRYKSINGSNHFYVHFNYFLGE